jgi:hypothetical protein
MSDVDKWPYLVVLETQKVKSYLFASPFLRETRGASLLLDLCNRKKIEEKVLSKINRSSWEIIYLGGGSGRVLFKDDNDAQSFRKAVLALYRRETATGRVAVEIVDRGKEMKGKSLPNAVEWGVNRCKKSKLGRTEGVPMLAGRWLRPCTSCGQEPAEVRHEEFGSHFLCQGCRLKRASVNKLYVEVEVKPGEKRDRVLKTESELKEVNGPDFIPDFIYTTLSRYLEGKNRRLQLPQDFNEIGAASNPANYLGFIYADGNRMGEVLRELGQLLQGADDDTAIKALRAFSQLVDQTTREAAVEAVLTVVGTDREMVVSEEVAKKTRASELHSLKAEFLMAGGDDLILAVPAHCALDVAVCFIERYQAKTNKLIEECKNKGELPTDFAPQGLTTSAGVVIAHAHFPASDLASLAGDLMKIAKKKAAEEFGSGVEIGTLDFLVVSEAVSEPVRERRRREYVQTMANLSGSGLREVKLTERPYTAAAAVELIEFIRALKQTKVPRNKLKALYPVLFHHPLQAQFDALRIKERLRNTGNQEIDKLLSDFFKNLDRFPFRINPDNSWSTHLTEILELYDFIHKSSDGEASSAITPILPEVADAEV